MVFLEEGNGFFEILAHHPQEVAHFQVVRIDWVLNWVQVVQRGGVVNHPTVRVQTLIPFEAKVDCLGLTGPNQLGSSNHFEPNLAVEVVETFPRKVAVQRVPVKQNRVHFTYNLEVFNDLRRTRRRKV